MARAENGQAVRHEEREARCRDLGISDGRFAGNAEDVYIRGSHAIVKSKLFDKAVTCGNFGSGLRSGGGVT